MKNFNFLKLVKNEAKYPGYKHCYFSKTSDIKDESLGSSDWSGKLRYRVPALTPISLIRRRKHVAVLVAYAVFIRTNLY